MMKLLHAFGKIVLSGLLAVTILSAFSLVYWYGGVRMSNDTGTTDFKWKSRQLKTNMEEGFSWVVVDQNGFNNSSEIADRIARGEQIDNLLMGSSHAEAMQVKQSETTSSVMNQIMEQTTYNIGMSEHYIYRCVDNLSNAYRTYHPSKAIIIETLTIHLNKKMMEEVVSRESRPMSLENSGFLNVLKRVPAIKWVGKNAVQWILDSADDLAQEQIAADEKLDLQVLDEFLRFARASVPEGVQIIIYLHPRTLIDDYGTFIKQQDEDDRSNFARICKENNIIFLDMTDEFERLYEEEYVLAHGFTNTKTGVGHLNKYGHRAIAITLANILQSLEDN